MRRQLDDIHHLLRGRRQPGHGGLADVRRQVVLAGDLVGAIVQADERGVEVEVGVDGDGVADVAGEAEGLGEEHEGAGEQVVELAVTVPPPPVLVVAAAVVGPRAVHVLHDLVEEVADDGGPGEGRVGRPLEDILEPTGRLLLARSEGLLGAGEVCRYLGRCETGVVSHVELVHESG